MEENKHPHEHEDHMHDHAHDHDHDHAHDHTHTHGDGCACENAGELCIQRVERKSIWEEHGGEIRLVLCGAAIFAVALMLDKLAGFLIPSLILYLVAYVILAVEIYKKAGSHIRKGQIFDENLLMILASIGAFVIGEYPEAVAVILFYRVGELFEDIAVNRSRTQIGEVLDLRPETVFLIDGEDVREIPAEEAAVGDQIRIRPGDRIPLDGTVLEGESQIDTSPLTGEPIPVTASEGKEILSGCINLSGVLRVEVTQPLSESAVSRVLRSVEDATASKPHMERLITRFAKYYTPVVVIVALLIFLIPVLRHGDWQYWLRTACTFLVISCPCALVISVPLSFMTGIAAASKRGILFKSGEALEMVERINMVIVDKTGTLTNGKFGLQTVVADGEAEALHEEETVEERILRLCASVEGESTHPLAQSILRAADNWELELEEPEELEEQAGRGIRAVLSEGTVLCGSRSYMEENKIAIPDDYLQSYGSEVYVALNGIYLGRLLLADKVKAGAESLMRAIWHIGAKPVILTGDKEANARAVGKYLGIKDIYAELLPDEKLDMLRKLRKKRGRAFFIGDGINDAPVMAGADVSGAMASGADAAVEAADIVYMTSDLKAVEESIDLAFQTKRIAWENILLALVIKLGVIYLGMRGYANMWMAILADTGVLIICVVNAVRVLFFGKYRTNRRQRSPEEANAGSTDR